MKYTLLLFFAVYTLRGFVRGQTITLTPSTTSVDINMTFGLTVQVEGLQNPGEVHIQGVDKFTVRGQAQSTSMQLVNGQQSSQIQLQLQLQPTATGSFTIGPARIALGTGEIFSNSITIDVTGEKLFLQPQQAATLLGVQEEQIPADEDGEKEIPQEQSGSYRWWRGVLIVVLVGMLLARKKYASWRGMKPILSTPSQKKLPMQIPAETDEAFRIHMDMWWREKLSELTDTDCLVGTTTELLKLSNTLGDAYAGLFSEAFARIEQVRYAGSEEQEHRSVLIDLAHRLSLLMKQHD